MPANRNFCGDDYDQQLTHILQDLLEPKKRGLNAKDLGSVSEENLRFSMDSIVLEKQRRI